MLGGYYGLPFSNLLLFPLMNIMFLMAIEIIAIGRWGCIVEVGVASGRARTRRAELLGAPLVTRALL
jgi:hypothetical protein